MVDKCDRPKNEDATTAKGTSKGDKGKGGKGKENEDYREKER